MTDDTLREQINKRLTLNWLIQGAAQHAGMTFHHLVRDDLQAVDPDLIRLYDQFALINLLQYWHLEAVMLLGWPPRFWRRAASKPSHPFFAHPLLSRHGGMLAAASRQRAVERCREKGMSTKPFLFQVQAMGVLESLRTIETAHADELTDLARQATVTAWGIPAHRLDARLTSDVAFGNLRPQRTLRGVLLRKLAVGYGGVIQRDDSLYVVARAPNWQLLAKELVKGTAELICLHGLNQLSDETYERVMLAADVLVYEPWMLHTGGELWRRVLAVIPDGRPVAHTLMHLARLPAKSLETLMLAVIEQPQWARELFAGLGMAETPDSSDQTHTL